MEPVRVEFPSEGEGVCGRFFRADGAALQATLLLVPGWPGNPDDVLGQGALLSRLGVSVLMFNPRGLHRSEGTASFRNTLADIRAAWHWLQQADVRSRFGIEGQALALGGHSFGASLALTYAAGDPSVRRVIAIAPNEHGAFIREFQRSPAMAAAIRRELLSTRAPKGPARFDLDAVLQELAEHQDLYGLPENAAKLADRSILLIGGWEDAETTIEQCQLPFYRALRREGAAGVTFLVYHTDHSFGTGRERVAADIAAWLQAAGPR